MSLLNRFWFLGKIFLFSYLLCFIFVVRADELLIVVPEDVYADYINFIADQDPIKVQDYFGEYSRRDVVEVVLVIQALHLGGNTQQIKFKLIDSYQRILVELKIGRAALSATTVWGQDANEGREYLYISEPFLASGEFEAGLYTAQSNRIAQRVSDKESLQRLSAVSNPAWQSDWELLSKLINPDKLYKTTSWNNMVKMVSTQRADILLAPFQSTPDMSLSVDGDTLVPIKNIKVALAGSRNIVFSKQYPNSEEIFHQLNSGIKQLQKHNTIRRAYEESGFINRKVKDWVLIK